MQEGGLEVELQEAQSAESEMANTKGNTTARPAQRASNHAPSIHAENFKQHAPREITTTLSSVRV